MFTTIVKLLFEKRIGRQLFCVMRLYGMESPIFAMIHNRYFLKYIKIRTKYYLNYELRIQLTPTPHKEELIGQHWYGICNKIKCM